MSLAVFPSGPFSTNAYVFACPETLKACIVDPAPESREPLIAYIENNHLKPEKLLLTHSHWDHIADAAPLIQRYHLKTSIHALDAPNLEAPGSDGLPCWIDIEGVKPDQLLNEGDKIQIGNQVLEVIHTPGHTPGGVCFYSPSLKLLLSGDTLFHGTIGNLSFPTARPNLMWQSLKKLAKLPPDTRVFPGHGEATTIGNESWLSRAEELFS